MQPTIELRESSVKARTTAQKFVEVRNTTDRLTSPLTAEDQMVQAMPDASPTKWHLAHTTWFFETFILLPRLSSYRALDSRYTYLFNSYYKQLGGHPNRAGRGLFSRPTLEQVRDYRRHVDKNMLELLESPALGSDVASLVEVGVNHEQQHQELIITDIKHAFWLNPLRPAYSELREESYAGPPQLRWFDYNEGLYWIGHQGSEFSFDNEGPRHQQYLQAFRLASRLVTNAEYLEFMKDNGYSRPELWLSDGWDSVCANQWNAPLYWEKRDGEWWTYTLNGEERVRLSEPVCHVSYYEADAYARWAGVRLPGEAELEIAASQVDISGNFLESGRFHPEPVSLNASPEKPLQLFGDLWEWTASPYTAYPGFRATTGALGEYNGKFMCNQMVLRGGSCATPRSHIRATYRNFFPAHVRWQFMGIRLADGRS